MVSVNLNKLLSNEGLTKGLGIALSFFFFFFLYGTLATGHLYMT